MKADSVLPRWQDDTQCLEDRCQVYKDTIVYCETVTEFGHALRCVPVFVP